MPDPESLKIGDKVRFISRPEEWQKADCVVCKEDIDFMDTLIERSSSCRVSDIDEYGKPWVDVRLRVADEYEYHSWAIMEKTGWCKVKPRSKKLG